MMVVVQRVLSAQTGLKRTWIRVQFLADTRRRADMPGYPRLGSHHLSKPHLRPGDTVANDLDVSKRVFDTTLMFLGWLHAMTLKIFHG